jgi:23S rRNA (adenine2503-C2)-methyltransferase
MFALQAATPDRLRELVPSLTPIEARKIVASVHRDEPLGSHVRDVRKVSLEAVRAIAHVPALEVRAERASALDPFRKVLLGTHDGHAIESVRIPLERAGRFSACVSSQVGCALACAFCATGRMGLVRNLETWEIVEQVRVIRRTIGRGEGRVHGVVFQGMGEPLANADRVIEAIRVFSDPCALAIDARSITVCTSGLPAGIRRLAKEAPRVRLAISIGSGRPEVRRSLMPIDRAHSLDEVLDAAVEHARVSGQVPLFAITPLAGVNDTEEDARAFATRMRDFIARAGVRPRVSLVPYNSIGEGDPFRRADADRAEAFRAALVANGVMPHLRYSGGSDVAAACGQLAAKGLRQSEAIDAAHLLREPARARVAAGASVSDGEVSDAFRGAGARAGGAVQGGRAGLARGYSAGARGGVCRGCSAGDVAGGRGTALGVSLVGGDC